MALLGGAGGNVCCVGDDDQLLYSWRGAEPRNILAFAERFPAHARIVLGRNCSRAEILDAAAACVAHNTQREPKALIAMRGGGGEVRVIAYGSDRHEADSVAAAIAHALAGGIPAGEVLVLARTGYATGPLQAALARAGIPHRVLGSLGLYERSEVRDALAYLALLANPADAQAFKRAVGAPKRGVGVATANRVVQLARETRRGDLISASAHADALENMRPPVRDRLRKFGGGLERVRCELRQARSIGHVVVAALMLDGGLVQHHQQRRDNSPKPDERQDAERVLEDLRSLCRAAQAYAATSSQRMPASPASWSRRRAFTPTKSPPASPTGGSPSRPSTGPKGPRRSSSC